MATKLKSFSRSMATKVIALILFAACMTTIMAQLQYGRYQDYIPDSLFVSQFKDSDRFAIEYFNTALNDINNLLIYGTKMPLTKEYYYLIENGTQKFTNVPGKDTLFFEQHDKAYFSFRNGKWTLGRNTQQNNHVMNYGYGYFKAQMYNKVKIYIAYTDNFLANTQLIWEESRSRMMNLVIRIAAYTMLALLLVIYLIATTGRKARDNELHLARMDVLYSDILLGGFFFLLYCWLYMLRQIFYAEGVAATGFGSDEIETMIAVGIVTTFFSLGCGVVVLSMVRKAKASKFIKHSFCYVTCYTAYDFMRSLFDGRKFANYPLTKSLFYRQLLFIGTSALLVFLFLAFLFGNSSVSFVIFVLELVLVYWYVKGNNATYEQINRGFNESLEEQMKAERMKIALVTNVSHDLKTPLTSIISYIDLLSKEQGLSEEANDYIRILEEKANRLKTIVADLFDLARSTSGDISMELESLDIKKLVEQTLADMEDRIKQSELSFKVRLPERPVTILADGKKLYRVFQNVIDNALKYSMPGTRVFIELEEMDGRVVANVKNTAGYEMDFTAFEILQRFNRGDKARSTEGSGLGLSIAESFTEVCGGNFKVEVDGDLFKVTIMFHTSKSIL